MDNPQAAQKKDDWWSWVFADTWTQPGYWITKARSERCTYPNVFVESKFKQGMTWQNHGKWHIDHIVPLYKFDPTKYEDIKKANHYSNLQPLWAEENLKKNRF